MRFSPPNTAFFSRLFRRKQEVQMERPVSGHGLSAQEAEKIGKAVRRVLNEYGDVLTRLAHE